MSDFFESEQAQAWTARTENLHHFYEKIENFLVSLGFEEKSLTIYQLEDLLAEHAPPVSDEQRSTVMKFLHRPGYETTSLLEIRSLRAEKHNEWFQTAYGAYVEQSA